MEKEEIARRRQFFYDGVAAACDPVCCVRCINGSGHQKGSRDYVVTLRKGKKGERIPAADRVQALERFLRENCLPDEALTLENDSFVITGKAYRFSFSVEWYKHANAGLTTQGNKPGVKLLRRVGVERAVSLLRRGRYYPEIGETETMRSPEWTLRYPNPADRFACIILTKARHERDAQKGPTE